ncbi:MAG TPA: hypothetical protein VFA74_00395 [Terriglobales bacterium]|nr:hypothetical protein [Terriglobales bacterium]
MTDPSDNLEPTGFGGQIKDGLKAIGRGVGVLAYALVMAPYYWTWMRKERIRRRFRLGSFIVLISLASLLIIEFTAEYYGAHRLADFLRLSSVAEGIKLGLFLAAATFIIFHYQSEIKKPEYEFKFVISLLTLMSKRREGTEVNSLQIFHTLFSKANIANVSAYTHKENRLARHSCFSKNPHAIFLEELAIKTSVGGRVLSDGAVRYVPRLFLPNVRSKRRWLLYMPHALKFKFNETYELDGRPRVERDVFSGDRSIQFCSLLSVPIKLGKDQEGCIGVLNFEFGAPGTLDAVDIAMASVYATWFGREVLKSGGFTPYTQVSAAVANIQGGAV